MTERQIVRPVCLTGVPTSVARHRFQRISNTPSLERAGRDSNGTGWSRVPARVHHDSLSGAEHTHSAQDRYAVHAPAPVAPDGAPASSAHTERRVSDVVELRAPPAQPGDGRHILVPSRKSADRQGTPHQRLDREPCDEYARFASRVGDSDAARRAAEPAADPGHESLDGEP